MLSDSYRRTIMRALAHERTPAAIETLWELRRQGWDCPAWIVRDVLLTPEQVRLDEERYGHVAGWR